MLVWWNRQTRRTQNPLLATVCGFKSHHQHQEGRLRYIYRIVKAGFPEMVANFKGKYLPLCQINDTVAKVVRLWAANPGS